MIDLALRSNNVSSYMIGLSFYCSIRSTITEKGEYEEKTTYSDTPISIRITNNSGCQ